MPKDPAGHLIPGRPSPTRAVPAAIARPEYVGRAAPSPNTGGDRYSPDEVERIRAAGRVAAGAIEAAAAAIRPGVTTDELDRIAHEYVVAHGAYRRRSATAGTRSPRARRSTRSSATASPTTPCSPRATW